MSAAYVEIFCMVEKVLVRIVLSFALIGDVKASESHEPSVFKRSAVGSTRDLVLLSQLEEFMNDFLNTNPEDVAHTNQLKVLENLFATANGSTQRAWRMQCMDDACCAYGRKKMLNQPNELDGLGVAKRLRNFLRLVSIPVFGFILDKDCCERMLGIQGVPSSNPCEEDGKHPF